MRCDRLSTFSWNRVQIIQAAARQSGMLMRKMPRQRSSCAKMPPKVGPTTAEIAQTLAM